MAIIEVKDFDGVLIETTSGRSCFFVDPTSTKRSARSRGIGTPSSVVTEALDNMYDRISSKAQDFDGVLAI